MKKVFLKINNLEHFNFQALILRLIHFMLKSSPKPVRTPMG